MPLNESNITNKSSELLQIQEELLIQAQITEQIHDSIITTDLNGNIISWNYGSQLIFGYEKEDAIGKHISLLYLKGNSDVVDKTIKYLKVKDRFDTKINLLTQSNEIIQIEQTQSILKDDNNKPIRVIFYSKDITYKEVLRSEIDKQEKIIMEQSQHAAMGEMIGNIAHQWRQPLSVIATGASGMKIKKEHQLLDDEEFYKICDVIDENAQYLSRTIDDFKNFIRGDRVKKEFNFKKNIDSFLSLVDSTIKTNDITIICNVPDNITISGYPNELNQCFINIFNNAKDALKEKNIEDKLIFLTVSEDNENITSTILDNAGGIPDKIIVKIFEPYFTTKHQSQGTGLGLHMSYNIIVNGMNGTLRASNENFTYEGKDYTGAKFEITLPK